jgi:DNA sulfur modification protein DndD
MKLIELQLYNFRQFYGEPIPYKIIFATAKDKNITVIHGNNGSGKTTILNAFTWLFYESFTEAFQEPEQLVNNRAIQEAPIGSTIKCWVKLLFEHEGKKYYLKRTQEVTKTDDYKWTKNGESILDMQSADITGEWIIEESPIDVIGRILPKQLHRYFFLDGERIEALQRPDKKAEIMSATQIFIGELVFKRSIDHLKNAGKKLESELKQLGDSETQSLINEKERNNEQIEDLERQTNIHSNNIEGYTKQINSIKVSLRQQENAKKLQERRDELERQQSQLLGNNQTALNQLSNIVSNSGYKVYLKNMVKTFQQIIGDLRKRGELPSSIKAPFVEDLLRRQECICGTELICGEEPFEKVKAWLERCGISEIEEIAIKMGAKIEQLERDTPKLFESIDREKKVHDHCKEQLSKIQEELEQIREDLGNSPEENVRELQNRLETAEKNLDNEKAEIVLKEDKIVKLNDEINNINQEIAKRKSKNAQHKLAQKRFSACNEAIKIIEQVQSLLRQNFRKDLDQRIKRIFTEISFKPYIPVLNEDYSLKLYEDNESINPVGSSTGENQILSLSFIGAIIEQARDFTSYQERLPGPNNSEFPIVLDSTFGSLDPIYRRHIATQIPILANQVIIMVSKSQWKDEVEKATSPKIGKEYVLEYLSPKHNAEEATLERKGETYNLIKKTTDQFESTNIIEVN